MKGDKDVQKACAALPVLILALHENVSDLNSSISRIFNALELEEPHRNPRPNFSRRICQTVKVSNRPSLPR